MRQALVIKNPKWEPFTSASDAFKGLDIKTGESAVLVVRGRCKERNSKLSKVIAAARKAAAVALMFVGFSAFAQENLTAKASGPTITGATTNTSAANGVVGWNIDQVAVFQASSYGTNAATTNAITFKLDVSDNGTDWVLNAHSFTNAPAGTSTGTAIHRITNSIGGKYFRVGRVENLNAATATFNLTVSLK